MNKLLIVIFSLYSALVIGDDVDCTNPVTTFEVNYCAALKLEKLDVTMNEYLAKSKEHNSYDSELIDKIDLAQKSWVEYSEAHCLSIYTMWKEGTIRGWMHFDCMSRATKQRTHQLWDSFLTYMDGSPPVLPEPNL